MDFVVCLGGDGTILHASSLFQRAIPPVVSFSAGSLGFLTNLSLKNVESDLRAVIYGCEDLDQCSLGEEVSHLVWLPFLTVVMYRNTLLVPAIKKTDYIPPMHAVISKQEMTVCQTMGLYLAVGPHCGFNCSPAWVLRRCAGCISRCACGWSAALCARGRATTRPRSCMRC